MIASRRRGGATVKAQRPPEPTCVADASYYASSTTMNEPPLPRQRFGPWRHATLVAALLIASTSCTTPARRTEIGTAARVGPAKQPCPPPNDPAIQSLLRDDPLAFLENCLAHYRKNIRDYHEVFSRQEILSGGLSKRQTMEITFREEPFSVDMRWIENPGRASRVSYVRDRWRQGGTQFALVHLRGLLIRFTKCRGGAGSGRRPRTRSRRRTW